MAGTQRSPEFRARKNREQQRYRLTPKGVASDLRVLAKRVEDLQQQPRLLDEHVNRDGSSRVRLYDEDRTGRQILTHETRLDDGAWRVTRTYSINPMTGTVSPRRVRS